MLYLCPESTVTLLNSNPLWSTMRNRILFVVALLSCMAVSGNRVKRHLVFTEGSRLFFSVNVRDNLYNYSDFFAQVFGVKMDWDLPNKVIRGNKGRIQRRDLYRGIEHFMYQHNVNGSSCIEKFLCEAAVILPKSNLFLAQLYEIIFRGIDGELQEVKSCDEKLAVEDCPFSLTSVILGDSKFSVTNN